MPGNTLPGIRRAGSRIRKAAALRFSESGPAAGLTKAARQKRTHQFHRSGIYERPFSLFPGGCGIAEHHSEDQNITIYEKP